MGRKLVTRAAREIAVGDVVVWRGLYLPVIGRGRFSYVAGGRTCGYVLLALGAPVRGPAAMHPPAIQLAPDVLVTRWE